MVNKYLLFVFVAILPLVTLLYRGVVWGADSFAFMSVACGNTQYAGNLSSDFFASFLVLFNCNFLLIVFVMFLFYVLALFGIWVFGDFVLKKNGFLLPVLVGTITPLFFVEALRFENDFFGWTMSFMVLGLFTLYLTKDKTYLKITIYIIASMIALFSILVWLPSILVLLVVVFMNFGFNKISKTQIIGIITLGLIIFHNFIINSIIFLLITPKIVSEELPLIGIIFILHIIHFWKYIPKKYLIPTIGLTLLGLIKLKYMFLATPFLILGLINRHNTKGLWIKNKKIPLTFIIIILGIGWIITGINLYPTQNDLQETQNAIQLSNDLNIPIYNDFGYGWQITWLGKETEYKISFPNPDYNNLKKPFIAYTKQKLDCTKINSKTYLCES